MLLYCLIDIAIWCVYIPFHFFLFIKVLYYTYTVILDFEEKGLPASVTRCYSVIDIAGRH